MRGQARQVFILLCLVGYAIGQNYVPVITDYSALNGKSISEGAAIDTTIGVINAYDPDDPNAVLTFKLDGDGAEYFAIGENTGVVILKKRLDFENDAEIPLTITVTDEFNQKTTVQGKILVNDANDNLPVFSKTDIFRVIPESEKEGYVVSDIGVTDVDTKNSVIQVVCVGDTVLFKEACDTFHLKFNASDTSNQDWKGVLVLAKKLDYEKRISYAIKLKAFDGLTEVFNEVHIEVRDVNDAPPVWVKVNPRSIAEELPIGTSIMTVTATDSDTLDRHQIRYEIIGADKDAFDVNRISGEVTVAKRLDFDEGSHPKGVPYDITIKASEVLATEPDGTEILGDKPFTTATVAISITVSDIDDNPPEFNLPEYRAVIPETIESGAIVPGLQMTITDIDSGTFNAFELVTLDYKDVFGVIPEQDASSSSATLIVKNGQLIDYESATKSYVIRIEARENKVPASMALTGSATVVIDVQDRNDQIPDFKESIFYETISETANPGSVVIDLNAEDDEAGNFGANGIVYKMYGNNPPHFALNERSGVITVAACVLPNKPGVAPCIDFEKKKHYLLTVSATDNFGLPISQTRSVQVDITVRDENDNVPVPLTEYERFIIEGQTVTVNPLVIDAEDPDTVGGPLSYTIIGGPEITNYWQIKNVLVRGEMVGNITATRPILYSYAPDASTGTFKFSVQVSDNSNNQVTQVTIKVIDINNNAPEFNIPVYRQQISEATMRQTSVITVTASDADAPTTGNGVIDFSISEGALGKFFIRDSRRIGSIFTADIYTTSDARFDFSSRNKYTMTLVATDRGTPESKSGLANLIVDIIDTNNNDPYIDPASVSITVTENALIDTSVYKINAYDRDANNNLKFSMVATRAIDPNGQTVDENIFKNLFRIDRDTGIVRVNKPLDRDTASFITNEVTVEDVAANPVQFGSGFLFITVTEYNDQAPYFDLPFYNLTIEEEANLNSFVLNLHCNDPDDKIGSYTLKQLDPPFPKLFELIRNSGAMIVNGRIDYETLRHVKLEATCTDEGNPSLSNTTIIDVTVININDNAPVFVNAPYRAQVNEGPQPDAFIIKVSATDDDAGDFGVVRYRLSADAMSNFIIDSVTGVITVAANANFDRETVGSLGFEVIAYDSPNHPDVRKETTAPVYITIIDENDNCPVFRQNHYEGSIPESAEIDTDIIDLLATDADFGYNAAIEYSITPNSGNPPESTVYFGVGHRRGRIITARTVRKKSGTYNFNVTATDQAQNVSLRCSSQVSVTVVVTESQNDAPIWIRPPNRDYVIEVLESQYEGMLVYSAKAQDTNIGPSGIVDYYFNYDSKLVSSTPDFRINQVTGVIRAQVVYDREQKDRYFLSLVARDQGNPSASSETTLIVSILDVDDNDPVFPTKDGEVIPLVLPDFVLNEGGSFSDLLLGSCNATDADSDHKNNKIYYDLLATDMVQEYISVDRETCDIRLKKPIDFETVSKLEFDIFAYNEKNDDSVRRLRRAVNPSIIPVIVQVNNINDSPPVFSQDQYFACAAIDSPFRQTILDVDATDPDQDGIPVVYSLEDSSAFNIDEVGVIYNVISFRQSQSNQRVYNLKIEASDGINNPSFADATIFITSKSETVQMQVNRPLTDVEPFKEQIAKTLVSSNPNIVYACVTTRNHIGSDGKASQTISDVLVSAVRLQNSNYVIYTASELVDLIEKDRAKPNSPYAVIEVTSVQVESDDSEFSLSEDSVLAILIIALLLLFFAIVLFCLACFCIWNKKKKKTKKIKSHRATIVQVAHDPEESSFNVLYHNAGEDTDNTYASVKKTRPAQESPIAPVVIPAPENLEPVPTQEPSNPEPVEPEPVIETEVLPEPTEPMPPRATEPEYEDRIETTVVEDPLPEPPAEADTPAAGEDAAPPAAQEDLPPPSPPPAEAEPEPTIETTVEE